MKVTALSIPDVLLIEPKIFKDKRGYFFESFNLKIFEKKTGLAPVFVQDNHSKSNKRILRGLHYQLPPKAQSKLIRVISGKIYDIAVDIRKKSPFFGKWIGETLSDKNKKQIWIPEGFAHGFLVLSDEAEIIYKTTEYYYPKYERLILWNDQQLNIKLPFEGIQPIVSKKDKKGKSFCDAEYF